MSLTEIGLALQTRKRVKLVVYGIKNNLDQAGVINLFGRYGTVTDVRVDAKFCSLYMDTETQALNAIENISGKQPLNLRVKRDKMHMKQNKDEELIFKAPSDMEIDSEEKSSQLEDRPSSEEIKSIESSENSQLSNDLVETQLSNSPVEAQLSNDPVTRNDNQLKSKVFGRPLVLQYHEALRCCLCNNVALIVCSQCHAGYCSVKCQENDWEEHRDSCQDIPSPLYEDEPISEEKYMSQV